MAISREVFLKEMAENLNTLMHEEREKELNVCTVDTNLVVCDFETFPATEFIEKLAVLKTAQVDTMFEGLGRRVSETIFKIYLDEPV